MSKRSFSYPSWTSAATADAAGLTNTSYMALGALSASAGLLLSEIYIGGQATSSAVQILVLRRDSVIMVTPALSTAVTDGPLNSFAPTAATAIPGTSAGTPPTPTATTTSAKLNLSMNAFGGIVRWVAYPGEEWGIIGVTVSVSESSLSGTTGTTAALLGSHMIYEAF